MPPIAGLFKLIAAVTFDAFGRYIVEFEQQEDDRAQYGTRIQNNLADRLKDHGYGFPIMRLPKKSKAEIRSSRRSNK